ncbi:MAG: FdrA family protein, partial [Nocardioides sp.]
AQVAMATPLNVEVLTEMGFAVPDGAGANDLVVAVRLDADGDLDSVLGGVDAALREAASRPQGSGELAPARTTSAALRDTPDAVVLVSVPGQHALVEAMDAIEAGCDVMVFSDNVPVESELALKRAATGRGVLVMGPDCGTAVIGGVGLGFANIVEPGPVGIVAASGTGCQQLLALLDHAGVGVTSALGVGGRDLSTEVGGLSTLEALRRLDADPAVKLIVLVSKPPAPEVAIRIEEYAATLATPIELALLGPGRPDLTAATESLLRRLRRAVPDWPIADPARSSRRVSEESRTLRRVSGGSLRGLFVGGTLCTEATLIATETLGPIGGSLADLASPGHAMVDFGDDSLTAGRAHPMIDPTVRLEHLGRAATDDATGVLILDLVLGHGAEPDPAAMLAPVLAEIHQPVVVAVVGTAADPQGLNRQIATLAEAGAEVHLSNAGAVRRAVALVGSAR